MYLIAIAWGYVVLMMAAAEATSANGTVLGAVITLLLYGVLPLALLMYILGTPARKRRRQAAEAYIETTRQAATQAATQRATQGAQMAASATPDGSGQPAGAAVAAEGKEA